MTKTAMNIFILGLIFVLYVTPKASCGGDPNARPGCGVNCGRLCSNYNKEPQFCPLICNLNGCDCKDGYVFDDTTRKCVRPQNCPPECGQNEVYSNCTNGGCKGGQNCDDVDADIKCVKLDPKSCKKGCICQEDYVRNSNGVCVPKQECQYDGKCNRCNEFYDTCPPQCSSQNCADIGKVIDCPPQAAVCRPGCRCAKGYFRNSVGECVLKQDCNITGGNQTECKENEEYDLCPTRCPARKCGIDDRLIFCPRQPVVGDSDCPPPTCRCKSGYYRNYDGNCVTWNQCPSNQTCNLNEVFDECPARCPPRVCGIDDRLLDCIPQPIKGDPKCLPPTCRCKNGFYRNDKEVCVKWEDCPTCNNPNEVYDPCPAPCPPRRCDVDERVIRCAAPPQVGDPKCMPGCRCADGFVRNDKGICVTRDQCSPTCGKNEEFSTCTQGVCRNQLCSQKGHPVACPDITEGSCLQGCVCKENFLRLNNGTCVPEDQCNPNSCNGDPNAVPGCGVNCGRHCSNYNSTEQISCIQVCYEDGCDCKKGYYYDDNTKKCVLPNDCSPTCGINEEFSTCKQGTCRNQDCSQKGKPAFCPPMAPGSCMPGCVCKKKFLRQTNGTCIPEDQCTLTPTCANNEEFSNCTQAVCRNQLCSQKGNPVACPGIAEGCCLQGCVCKENFFRLENGTCVPEDQCNSPCGANERYSTCIQAECRALTCDQRGQSIPCPRVIRGFCKKGCVCNEGYLRDNQGKCILEEQCNPCPDDEIWNTCPPQQCDAEYCPKSRDDPQACVSTKECKKPRCTCGFNQKRNRKTQKCISISSCPPFSCDGPNEEYQSCPASCPGEQCSDYINNSTCSKFKIGIVVPCRPQCKCKKNYFRNSQKVCVEAQQCLSSPVLPTNNTCDGQQRLTTGINDFAFEFLKQVLKIKKGENIIMSPLSAQIALTQLALGTSGKSLQQLLSSINLTSKDEIQNVFKGFLQTLHGDNNVTFTTANKIYVNKKFTLSKKFNAESKDVLNSTVENIDCSQPKQAADIINKWVEDNTNKLIKNLISKDVINDLLATIIINALYFQGTWKYEFNKNDTQKRDFRVSPNKTVQIDTMYIKKQFNYVKSEELNAQIVELPFVNELFKIIIALPEKDDGLSQTAEKLNAYSMKKALDSMTKKTCELWLPRMEIETALELTDILKALGITGIFDTKDSGIDGILENAVPLAVSAVLQKAVVKVNEKGGEAAAATAIIVALTAVFNPTPDPVIRCDHPFFIYIYFKDYPIFIGAYQTA